MRVLFIGGTRFVGRHAAEAAVARGHDVTVFHRGLSGAALAGCHVVLGDRNDLLPLGDATWDAVIDTCGYVPRVVGISCDTLTGRTGRYLFVSSVSVYADTETPMQDEDAPRLTLSDPSAEEVTGETYGGLKALCEDAVLRTFGDRATIVRPGLVVGPLDPTDRLTYWVRRFSTPGAFVAPDVPRSPVQFVDARDLGGFMVRLCEDDAAGTFHACGPTPPISFGDFVSRGTRCFSDVARPRWLDLASLKSANLEPWSDFPLVPSFEGADGAYLSLDNARALASGLTLRPLEETLRDTADWWQKERAQEPLKAGLSDERQAELMSQKSDAPA